MGMSNFNRKYPKVNGWWCYCLITPDGMFYIGCSGRKECWQRWNQNCYKNECSFALYIDKYGWDNMRKVVLCDCLTEDQAKKLEDLLIQEARKGGWCINKQRSGNISKSNPKEYNAEWMREWRGKNKQHYLSVARKYQSKIENRIYHRVYDYNLIHIPIETPKEAKQKYLETGYIPIYIKNDDLK